MAGWRNDGEHSAPVKQGGRDAYHTHVDRQPGSRERAFVRWKSIDTGHSAGDHCSTRRGDQLAAAHTAWFAATDARAADINPGTANAHEN
jgi:hypothetical protein